MPLYDLPAFGLAAISAWLGLSLMVRDPHDRVTRAFAWLCLHLTLYGLATALAPITTAAVMARFLLVVQAIGSVMIPPAVLHFILRVTSGDFPRRSGAALIAFYVLGALLSLYALFGPGMQQELTLLRFPEWLTWPWIVQRLGPTSIALWVMIASYREAGIDDLTRRRRLGFTISLAFGVSGAAVATLLTELRLSPAAGHALIALGMVVLALSVLVYRSLLPERVARRAVYRSMIGGVLTMLYVAVVAGIGPSLSDLLAIEGSYVTVISLVVVLAVAGPFRDWVSEQLDRIFFHREFDFGNLLRSVGDDLLERGTLREQLETTLAAICDTLSLKQGLVAVRDARGLHLAASYGEATPESNLLLVAATPTEEQSLLDAWEPWRPAQLLIPLWYSGSDLGVLALGGKRSGEPFSPTERALLGSLGSYLALAIRHDRRQQEEQIALAALAEQSRQLQAEQDALLAHAAEARASQVNVAAAEAPREALRGLRVAALGPLRVERDGKQIERWGGDKAGTYQAEALFAFLFDRRGRGVTKDEAAEVIWPDLELDKADMAFHRTVSGLRRTLEPGLKRGNESTMLTYHHERYWLSDLAVGWCDVEVFEQLCRRGHALLRQQDLEGAQASFAEALTIYRGEYLDDCPFYGDSAYVEPRRAELRDQHLDTLLTLGLIYERLGQFGEAATCYRRALSSTDGDCPRAEEGLERLQADVGRRE
ncbi:MAG: hypothetical protein Fur005_30480 [Roseiflexaceae bacterium]